MRKLLSSAFIISGIIVLLFSFFLILHRNNPNRLSFDINNMNSSQNQSELVPIGIKISSINVNLPIVYSSIADGKWEATENGVSYLSQSVIPGEIGNSILYGHNWRSILGNLPKVKPGDLIEIYYENGTKKTFEVSFTQIVEPTQTSILDNTEDTRITLYTCTGFLDTKRFVVTAVLI